MIPLFTVFLLKKCMFALMNTLAKSRIESLDLLKGLVIILMTFDHVREYFHAAAFYYEPTNLEMTTLPIFFSRWMTHFCAPVFCFLAGTSAFLVGRRQSKTALAGFLLKRGLWLMVLEFTVITFSWYFDVHFKIIAFFVIAALGFSMICLAGLIFLPRWALLTFSLVMIFGHNCLDGIDYKDNLWWELLHQARYHYFSENFILDISYPVVPWIGVMSLGYYFGAFYTSDFDAVTRRKWLNIIGASALVLFVMLRWFNIYGESSPWVSGTSASQTFMSFFNLSKYPPSLLYLLMTLGTAFIILANIESLKGRVVNFFSTFGRVPFFYYILHLYLIHLLAMLTAQLTGFGWNSMLLTEWIDETPQLRGYGFGLIGVSLVWLSIFTLLYPLCRWFDVYKQSNKDKWWLSYL